MVTAYTQAGRTLVGWENEEHPVSTGRHGCSMTDDEIFKGPEGLRAATLELLKRRGQLTDEQIDEGFDAKISCACQRSARGAGRAT